MLPGMVREVLIGGGIMDNRLQRYLGEHQASAEGALKLVDDLLERLEDGEEKAFLASLKDTLSRDQESLSILITAAGLDSSLLEEMAGSLSARVSRLKLAWDGLEPGQLGFLEACEMLALGVQGKRLMWLALEEIASFYPEWRNVDFKGLQEEAAAQRELLEAWVVKEAGSSLGGHR